MKKIILVIVFSVTINSYVVCAEEYAPGEVIVSFHNKTVDIFSIDKTGMSSIYPDLMT